MQAFARSQEAQASGDLMRAQRELEYAQRLAPSDGAITLALASVRLQRRDPTASEPFELVARRDDVREAWLGLAATRRMIGQTAAAARELAQSLARHAPPMQDGTLAFHDDVAREAGFPGWCGLDSHGRLLVSLADAPATRGLVVRLAGVDLPKPAWARQRMAGRERLVLALPETWRQADALQVTLRNAPLLGSPIRPSVLAPVEGFVSSRDGGLEGWAWIPGDPDCMAELSIGRVDGGDACLQIRADADAGDLHHPRTLARPRRFRVEAQALAGLDGLLAVRGADGRHLYGSPVDPGAERRSAAAAAAMVRRLFPSGAASPEEAPALTVPSVPADVCGVPATASRPRSLRRGVDVVIPVYRGEAETLACIASVLADPMPGQRVVVVDDASPDAGLVDALQRLAADGQVVLLRQPVNRGFPAAANAGMRAAGKRDVVLLNSDTLVPPGWLKRLRAAAMSAPDIGSVTPLSNDATILSYPRVNGENPVPDLAETLRLDGLARRVNAGVLADIPTAVGFCMYITRECLDAVGLLREDVFAQGYGEENDFCLRARHLGFRHVGAADVFVGHVGGNSFGAAKGHLIRRNLAQLERMHPGYSGVIARHVEADPLHPARQRMDEARWQAGASALGATILVTHDRVGGVKRRVEERCAAIRAQGQRPIVLAPARAPDGATICTLADDSGHAYPNLTFRLPAQMDALVTILQQDRPRSVEVHHQIGHDAAIMGLAGRLAVPMDMVLHDYASFCPRITLVSTGDRYCGEPDMARCEACVTDLGGRLDTAIMPAALVARSAVELASARRVITPSTDAARRIARHFPGIRPVAEPWEDDAVLPPAAPEPPETGGEIVVGLLGAVGVEKGFDLLLGCARDAVARRLPLRFRLVGYSCDDARLLGTGRVDITGPYEDADAAALLRSQGAHLGFLSSIWPETWSYVLTQMWQAGLQVAAFDLGAPAERIRRTGRGWLLPLGMGPAAVNDMLVGLAGRGRNRAAAE